MTDKIRSIAEVNLQSTTLTEDLVNGSSKQILELFESVLKKIEPDLPKHKNKTYVPIEVIYTMIRELKKKKATVITAIDREDAERIMDELDV